MTGISRQARLWAELLDQGRGKDAPLAVGGRLSTGSLLDAYRHGVFPEPCVRESTKETMRATHARGLASGEIVQLGARSGGDEIWWVSPDPRGAYLPGGPWRPGRSLTRVLRRSGWTTTVDRTLSEVMRSCRRHETSWITEDMVTSFSGLHDIGHAHSVEVWEAGELVGGLYGVKTGRVFSIESLFHRRTYASKVATVDFLTRFFGAGGVVADVQYLSEHLARTGARELPRVDFLALLAEHRDAQVTLDTAELPVDRLVPASEQPS